MLFNSLTYAVFLPAVFAVYWFVLNRNLRLQNLFLLLGSYIFYGWWDWRFLTLIVLSSFVDYFVGLKLAATKDQLCRRLLLSASLTVNLGALGFFKYFNFFADSLYDLLTRVGFQANPTSLDIILPVGISFYTFQTLSYTIDVYRRKLSPTSDIVAFFAFVAFFPQLVAGPIERAKNLLPQFQRARSFNSDAARDGMRRILWGLFKKVVVADTCARYVDEIFSNYATLPSGTLILGVVYFAFQIYGDFSGYSDIALGTARLLGFRLMQNFAFPYFSRDIAEFWRRWHISLSTWFRDYLYIPLGGSRTNRLRAVGNIITVFVVSGFWHGANWTFLAWGLLNGLYFVPLFLLGTSRRHTGTVAEGRIVPTAIEFSQMLITFALTCVAWVFFRSPTVSEAIRYLRALVSVDLLSTSEEYLGALPAIALLLAFEWTHRNREHGLDIKEVKVWLRFPIYLALWTLIMWSYSGEQEFIYFQF